MSIIIFILIIIRVIFLTIWVIQFEHVGNIITITL